MLKFLPQLDSALETQVKNQSVHIQEHAADQLRTFDLESLGGIKNK